MPVKKSISRKLLEKVVNGSLSFTTIGAGVAIVATWVLYSMEILVKPPLLVWAGIMVTGAGLGLVADSIQSYLGKYI